MEVHDTKSGDTKVVQINHGLAMQVAITGNARGEYVIQDGFPQIHKVVLAIIKFDPVWRVVCEEGYFMITVKHPDGWSNALGEILRTIGRLVDEVD